MQQVLDFLWRSIKGYRKYYLLMLIAPLFGALYKPIVYYAIKLMVDTITNIPNFTFKQILTPFLIYLIADVLLSTLWRVSEIASWKSEPYVQRGILVSALKSVLSFRYSFFQETSSGSITSKIKGLLDGYNELWAQLYYGVLFWVLSSITAGFSIFFVSKKLGFILFGWSTIYVWINYCFAKRVNYLSQQQNEAKHKIIGEISDNISNIQSIKLSSTRSYEYSRLHNSISTNYIPKEVKLFKFHFKVNIFNDFMGILMLFVMLIIMVYLRRANQVTVGDFVFVFSMVFQFCENLWHLMQEFHKFTDHMGDLKSSLSLHKADKSEYSSETGPLNEGLPKIEFRNVKFKHPKGKKIFDDLNLIIHPGEKVGIVGYTGAGKTTLINILLKTFTLQEGSILINDQDIYSLDSDELRKMIAVIPQDIALFNRSLIENIRYSRIDATDEDVILATKKAHAHEFIESMSDGYQTLVGERGLKLSGGQRQRIAISRAILKNAPILILDEATSALDSITEQHIQESIKEIIQGKTVLAIAHRLSTLKDMDRLIVINQGKIIEDGTHEQLVNKENGVYRKIWFTQYNKTQH